MKMRRGDKAPGAEMAQPERKNEERGAYKLEGFELDDALGPKETRRKMWQRRGKRKAIGPTPPSRARTARSTPARHSAELEVLQKKMPKKGEAVRRTAKAGRGGRKGGSRPDRVTQEAGAHIKSQN